MNTIEYLKYAIENGLPKNLKWWYSLFTIPYISNEYIEVKDNEIKVIVNNDAINITDRDTDKSILNAKRKIIVNKDIIPNIKKEVETNIGTLLLNYLLTYSVFGNKIPFMNYDVSVGKIEKDYIRYKLVRPEKEDDKTIGVDKWKKFSVHVSLVRNLGEIFVVSASEKLITPPDDLEQVKKKTFEEFNKKYGKDWVNDPVRLVEYENKLIEHLVEYLKDDPTFGVLASGKVIAVALKKQFIMIGYERGFNDGSAVPVLNSLHDGWPKNKKELATIINQSRAGSFDRGFETRDSGVVANILSNSTINIMFKKHDCKAKKGTFIKVNKHNAKELIGRYYIKNGKSILINSIDDLKPYMDKLIELRSPMRCLMENDNICSVCAGEVASRYEHAPSVMSMGLGGTFLNAKMKSMHGTINKTRKLTLNDFKITSSIGNEDLSIGLEDDNLNSDNIIITNIIIENYLEELSDIYTKTFKTKYSKNDLKKRLINRDSVVYVIKDNNKITGLASIRYENNKIILTDLVSLKKGNGTILLNHIKSLGYDIETNTWNSNIVKYYERQGFICKDKKCIYKNPYNYRWIVYHYSNGAYDVIKAINNNKVSFFMKPIDRVKWLEHIKNGFNNYDVNNVYLHRCNILDNLRNFKDIITLESIPEIIDYPIDYYTYLSEYGNLDYDRLKNDDKYWEENKDKINELRIKYREMVYNDLKDYIEHYTKKYGVDKYINRLQDHYDRYIEYNLKYGKKDHWATYIPHLYTEINKPIKVNSVELIEIK